VLPPGREHVLLTETHDPARHFVLTVRWFQKLPVPESARLWIQMTLESHLEAGLRAVKNVSGASGDKETICPSSPVSF
jgi:hypothetical protein